jgi:hypothetical protein
MKKSILSILFALFLVTSLVSCVPASPKLGLYKGTSADKEFSFEFFVTSTGIRSLKFTFEGANYQEFSDPDHPLMKIGWDGSFSGEWRLNLTEDDIIKGKINGDTASGEYSLGWMDQYLGFVPPVKGSWTATWVNSTGIGW